MGRAGGGSRSGGHSGGGHHSGSHSSGGHRVSSSSSGRRAGSGMSHGGGHGGFGGGYHSRPPRRHYVHHGPYHRPHHPPVGYGGYAPPPPRRSGGCASYGCATLIVLFIVCVSIFMPMLSGGAGIPASTANRERLDTGISYSNDCIVDELNWFDNTSSASRKLQTFFDKTGVQPYIYLKAYDAKLTTDAQKEAYAKTWYDEHIENESTFLYVYFAEKDQDGDVGFMCYVNGSEVSAVMDAEAVEIFWAYIDQYWRSDLSTDALFETVFTKTAKRIMTKSTTGNDIILWIVIMVAIVAAGVVIIRIMKTKRQHEKEANEETERILSTPISNSATDDLAEKYNNQNKGE